MKKILLCCLVAFQVSEFSLGAPIRVVTSTTDLAWALREIGGSHVEVTALLKGTENPHYIDAVPEFIRLVSDAQMVCTVGLDLEVGWMPKVLSRSGNAQVQPGGKGYCEAARTIEPLERPTGGVDRSMGDVHPSGNPHFWLGPKHFAQSTKQMADTLIGVDPVNAAHYLNGMAALKKKLDAIHAENRAKLNTLPTSAPLVLEYHKEFAYFLQNYGLQSFGSIEEKPGVAPSAGRLAEVALGAKAAGVRLVLASETAPKKILDRFSELSQIPVVTVPMSLQPHRDLSDYGKFQSKLVDAIMKTLTPAG